MPRSLLLTYDFPPMSGGIARTMGEVARHAASGSLVVSTGRVDGSAGFDRACPAPVDRVAVPSPRLRTLPGLVRWAWRADRLARDDSADFLWAGNIRPAGRVARWVGNRRRIPYGLIVYGLDVALLRHRAAASPFSARAVRRLLRDAAGVVAISRWTASRVADLARQLHLPDPAERVRVVPPGVDAARFRPGLGTDNVRAQFGLSARRWLLTVARLMPHKGIDRGLEALADLREDGLDVGYMIAGEGPARAELIRQAERLGLTEFVRWCGFVAEDDLPALYGAADVYLGLSREEGAEAEGFGLALLEAQASGVPVVAGGSGGTADAIAPGVSGLLVSPSSRRDIHQALKALLQDPARARSMGAAGRARAEREGTWTRVASDLEAAAAAFRTAASWGLPAGR